MDFELDCKEGGLLENRMDCLECGLLENRLDCTEGGLSKTVERSMTKL